MVKLFWRGIDINQYLWIAFYRCSRHSRTKKERKMNFSQEKKLSKLKKNYSVTSNILSKTRTHVSYLAHYSNAIISSYLFSLLSSLPLSLSLPLSFSFSLRQSKLIRARHILLGPGPIESCRAELKGERWRGLRLPSQSHSSQRGSDFHAGQHHRSPSLTKYSAVVKMVARPPLGQNKLAKQNRTQRWCWRSPN